MRLKSSKIINLSLGLSLGLFSVLSPVHSQTQREMEEVVNESLENSVLIYCAMMEGEEEPTDEALQAAGIAFRESIIMKTNLTKQDVAETARSEEFEYYFGRNFKAEVRNQCPEHL